MSRIKLTPPQRSLLARERHKDEIGGGREFILLMTASDDRVARSLEEKGYGTFQDNGWQYSWRKRCDYTNTFWVKK